MNLRKYLGGIAGFALLMLAISVLHQPAAGDPPPRTLRQYYLSTNLANGSQAPTACASGFHMASLAEIIDPSNLQYDTTLGFTTDDSGLGPPSVYPPGIPAEGWIRTGAYSHAGLNCSAWTSSNPAHTGWRIRMESDMTSTDTYGHRIGPWIGAQVSCGSQIRVWCVQDY